MQFSQMQFCAKPNDKLSQVLPLLASAKIPRFARDDDFSNSKRVGETLSCLAISVRRLQRAQEVQNFLLLGWAKVVEELLHDGVSFAAVAGVVLDSRDQVCGAAVVQQEDPLSEAPQGSGAELSTTRGTLRNVIRQAGAHVMDLNI